MLDKEISKLSKTLTCAAGYFASWIALWQFVLVTRISSYQSTVAVATGSTEKEGNPHCALHKDLEKRSGQGIYPHKFCISHAHRKATF